MTVYTIKQKDRSKASPWYVCEALAPLQLAVVSEHATRSEAHAEMLRLRAEQAKRIKGTRD